MTPGRRYPAVAAVALSLVGACHGQVIEPGGGGAGGSGPGNDQSALCQKNPDPGPTPLMKLSTVQYRNTVRDLLAASGLGALQPTVQPLLAAVPDDSPLTF